MGDNDETKNAEKLPPAWDRKGGLIPGRGSLNPGGKPKWVKEFQIVFRDRLAQRAADVLERVMDRALNVEDIEKAVREAEAQNKPHVIASLEGALNERYKQATNAAGHALKYILPVVKMDNKPTPEEREEASALRKLSTGELLALARKREKGEEH